MIPMNRAITPLVIVLGLSQLASAAPVVVPPGLQPGDQYRLVFVTSKATEAIPSIANLNQFVTDSANSVPDLAALGTTWKAIVTVNYDSQSIAAWDNTGTNPSVSAGVPIYNTHGLPVASSNADLWDGSLANPINYDEQETLLSGFLAWTGTYPVFGAAQAYPFGNGPLFTDQVYVGAAATDVEWAATRWEPRFNGNETTNRYQLYGMSGVLTVVPEPGTSALAVLAGLAWLPWRALSRRRNLRRS